MNEHYAAWMLEEWEAEGPVQGKDDRFPVYTVSAPDRLIAVIRDVNGDGEELAKVIANIPRILAALMAAGYGRPMGDIAELSRKKALEYLAAAERETFSALAIIKETDVLPAD